MSSKAPLSRYRSATASRIDAVSQPGPLPLERSSNPAVATVLIGRRIRCPARRPLRHLTDAGEVPGDVAVTDERDDVSIVSTSIDAPRRRRCLATVAPWPGPIALDTLADIVWDGTPPTNWKPALPQRHRQAPSRSRRHRGRR